MNRSESVRNAIYDILDQCGAAAQAPMDETLLIRQGVYCGHRFRRDGLQAVWFVDENQIKIFGRDGAVIECFEPAEVAARADRNDRSKMAA